MAKSLANIFRFHGPFRGLNDTADRRQLDPSWAADLNNVVIKAGAIESRPGYTVTNATAAIVVGGYSDNFTRVNGPAGGNWEYYGAGYPPPLLITSNQLSAEAESTFARLFHMLDVSPHHTFEWDTIGPASTSDIDVTIACIFSVLTPNKNFGLDFHLQHVNSAEGYARIVYGGADKQTCTTDAIAGTINCRAVVEEPATSQFSCTFYWGSGYANSLQQTAFNLHGDHTYRTARVALLMEGANTTVLESYVFDSVSFDYGTTAGRIYGLYNAKIDDVPTVFARSQRAMHKLSGTTFAQLHGNQTVATLPSFAVANDRVYCADSLTTIFRYTTTFTSPVGLTPPVLASLEEGDGTGLTGTYDYCVTVIDSKTSYESNPSNTSQVSNISNKDVNLAISVNANAHGDHMGIYRRKVSEGEPVYRLVTTTTFAAQWTDDIADADIARNILEEDNDTLPGTPELICWHEARMYYKLTEFPTRVYYSEPHLPESVPADNWNELGGSAGYEVKALIPAFGELVIFTNNSIVVQVGDADDTGSRITAVPGTGCVAHGSVVAIGNFVYFADENGVHRFDGQRAVLISKEIAGTWATLDSAQFKWMTAVNDQYRKFYLLSARTSGASENDIVLVYHYGEESAAAPGPWTKWDLEATCWARSDAPDVLYFGRADGTVGILGGWDDTAVKDSGIPISWWWKGARSDYGMAGQYKRFRYCTPLVAVSDVTGASMATGCLLEDDVNVVASEVLDRTIARTRPIHVGRYAQRMGMYFAASGVPAHTRILGFELDMGAIGRR